MSDDNVEWLRELAHMGSFYHGDMLTACADEIAELRKEVERLKGGKTRTWSRCLYCDASIAGDDAHVAILHDPYCPHGKSLQQLAEANKLIAAADPLAWCAAGGWNIPAAEWKERQAKWFESVWFKS